MHASTPRAPPGEKRSGERSRISWAFSPKLASFIYLTTVKVIPLLSSIRTFLSGFSAKCFERVGLSYQTNFPWVTSARHETTRSRRALPCMFQTPQHAGPKSLEYIQEFSRPVRQKAGSSLGTMASTRKCMLENRLSLAFKMEEVEVATATKGSFELYKTC